MLQEHHSSVNPMLRSTIWTSAHSKMFSFYPRWSLCLSLPLVCLSVYLSLSLSLTHISPKSLIYKSFHDSTSHNGIIVFHFFVGSHWLFSDWKRSILNCIFPVSGQNSFPSKFYSHAHTSPSASSKLNNLILCRTLHLLQILSPFLSSFLPICVKHFMIIHLCP